MDDEGLKPSFEVSPDLARLYEAERDVIGRSLTDEEQKGFEKKKIKKPNPCPFIKFDDLNNQTEKDILDCAPKRPAVVLGFKWEF